MTRRKTLILAMALPLCIAGPVEAKKRTEPVADFAALPSTELARQGRTALDKGEGRLAISFLSEYVARQPLDGNGQMMLALAWQMLGESEPHAQDMAVAGYDLASRAEPGQYWPVAMAGRVAFDQGKYAEATDRFSRAALLRPSDPRALSSLASAAYLNGDAKLARIAAERAHEIAPSDSNALRIALFAAAASGDRDAAEHRLAQLAKLAPDRAETDRQRANQLMQTEALDADAEGGAEEFGGSEGFSPDQISLDVAIILSQNTKRERTGINLLDGLSLQYGLNRQASRTFNSDSSGNNGDSYQRVLTSSISIPQLNYNLNLFNRGGQYYSVVARPQLTAYRGEESEFFVGRSLRVAVGGVNVGSLEQVDIGISMKVTPVEITPTGTRVRVETGRSFVTADPAGTFAEALTTFTQKVAATAEIRFGETLVLSGLSETVDDKTYSKTPVLGDIPVVGRLFHESNLTERRDSVLMLVTPSRPLALPGRPFARSDQVQRMIALWTQIIDPASNADAVTNQLSQMRMFTRMNRSDAFVAIPDARSAAAEILRETAPF